MSDSSYSSSSYKYNNSSYSDDDNMSYSDSNDQSQRTGKSASGLPPPKTRGFSSSSFSHSPFLTPPDQLPDVWRRNIKTGDIILFRSSTPTGCIIRCGTGGRYNHMGMAYVDQDGHISIWHATSSGIDIQGGQGQGPMESDLYKLANCGRYSDVAVRKLASSMTASERDRMIAFMEEQDPKDYEKKLFELVDAAVDGCGCFGQNSKDMSSVFCSELVAEALQELGRLDRSLPSNEYTPSDFEYGSGAPELNRVFAGQEQRLGLMDKPIKKWLCFTK